MLRTATVLALALTMRPLPAEATTCSVSSFATTHDVPLGCPVVYYEWLAYADPPAVTAVRGANDPLDVTGAMTQVEFPIDIEINELDCEGLVVNTYYSAHVFQRFVIELDGAQVGDRLKVGFYDLDLGVVTEAGECTEDPLPVLQCSYPPMEACEPAGGTGSGSNGDGDDDGLAGCHAGGGSAGILLALVIAFGAPLSRSRARRSRA